MSVASWIRRAGHRSSAESQVARTIERQKKKARALLAGDFAVLFNFGAQLWKIAKQLPPSELFPPCDLVLDRVIRFRWQGSGYSIEKFFDDDTSECIRLEREGTTLLCADCRNYKIIHVFLEGSWIEELATLIPHLRRCLADVTAWKAQERQNQQLKDLHQHFAPERGIVPEVRRIAQPTRGLLNESSSASGANGSRLGQQPLPR